MTRKDFKAFLRRAPSFVAGLVAITACLLGGYALQEATDVPVPPSVLGLVLYAALLLLVPAAKRATRPAATMLVRILGALIVPPFVALWLFRDAVAPDVPSILAILTGTSLLSAFVTAALYRRLSRG